MAEHHVTLEIERDGNLTVVERHGPFYTYSVAERLAQKLSRKWSAPNVFAVLRYTDTMQRDRKVSYRMGRKLSGSTIV